MTRRPTRDALRGAGIAEAYADQTERDFDAFTPAISMGRIEARTGV